MSPTGIVVKDLTIDAGRAAALRREVIDRPVIYIGTGTCGLGAGAGKVMDAVTKYLVGHAVDARIVQVGCIGLCAEEPMLDVQLPGKTRVCFGKVQPKEVDSILTATLAGQLPAGKAPLMQFRVAGQTAWDGVVFQDEHSFFRHQTRWVLENCGLIDPDDMDEYLARGGYQSFAKAIHSMTPDELCDQVEKSGLRGRGGAGFATGTKWKFARKTPADQKYLVCNADEGDPGAFMDRAVIEGDPHRVLEGIAIAAYAMGATKAYVYIRAEYPLAIKRLRRAIDAARAHGLLGENIQDSGFNLDVIIKMGAGAFVCGEETALLHSVEGKRGMPRPRPPYPAVSGLFGKPTCINNVETLANLPLLLRNGWEAFAAVGVGKSKGTKVFALSGKVVNTGLVEVKMGMTLHQVIMDVGGGIPNGKKFKAVQIGGPSGGCIPEQHLDLQVDYDSLVRFGAMMGSGGLVVMDEDNCMVDVAKYFMDFIQRESCGKCIPCREGTRRMLEVLGTITRAHRNEKENEALERFQGIVNLTSLSEVIQDTALCGLGQSASKPVISTLRFFRDEYEAHIFERRCPAHVCKELLNYRIDQDKCNGCMLCMKNCPSEAIMGALKTPHYIVEEKCIGCGSCVDVCNQEAVIAD